MIDSWNFVFYFYSLCSLRVSFFFFLLFVLISHLLDAFLKCLLVPMHPLKNQLRAPGSRMQIIMVFMVRVLSLLFSWLRKLLREPVGEWSFNLSFVCISPILGLLHNTHYNIEAVTTNTLNMGCPIFQNFLKRKVRKYFCKKSKNFT